jgi:nitroimidazol reductase NimA-like FMN-containing flavoprotein (pyridoxamine 5'-phosphate oxidase superfamily)
MRRGAARADYGMGTILSIIDAAPICHVAVTGAHGPLTLPMAHGRIDDTMYLHGALANSVLNAGLDGGICATFTVLDGLVVARSPFHNSMNYRCAVVMGTPQRIEGEEKVAAVRAVSEHVAPAWSHGRPTTDGELRRTLVVGMQVEEASAKVRSGDPVDEPEDLQGPWWAGTIPLTTTWGAPVDAADLGPDIAVPPAILSFARG